MSNTVYRKETYNEMVHTESGDIYKGRTQNKETIWNNYCIEKEEGTYRKRHTTETKHIQRGDKHGVEIQTERGQITERAYTTERYTYGVGTYTKDILSGRLFGAVVTVSFGHCLELL